MVVGQYLLEVSRREGRLGRANVPGHDAFVDLVDFGEEVTHTLEV